MDHEENNIDSLSINTNNNDILPIETIKISNSLSCLTTISLDKVLRKCGDFGRYQLIHYFFMSFITMNFGILSFYYAFALAEPDHRCRLPNDIWLNDAEYYPINSTHEFYINNYIPKDENSKQWKKCFYYSSINGNRSLVNCEHGWVYDRKIYGNTFTEEVNLICQTQKNKSWLATIVQIAGFSTFITGPLADRFGRKRLVIIITLVIAFVCFLTQIIMQWISITAKTKFFILLFNQFISGLSISNYSLVYILMIELTSISYTNIAVNLAMLSFAFGEILAALFAYIARDWQTLKWCNTIFLTIIIPYFYFMPESPSYLYVNGNYDELESILKRIAYFNKQNESNWYSCYQELLRMKSVEVKLEKYTSFYKRSYRILANRNVLIKLFITALIGLITLVIYFKISYNLVAISVSPYLATLIGSIVEGISYTASALLVATRLGRKGSFLIMMCLAVIILSLIPITAKYNSIATTVIVQLGKYVAASLIGISWIFVPELFPTTIRSTANGIFIVFTRIGAIVPPIIDASIDKDTLFYTYYILSGFTLIVLLFSLFLPETKDRSMDDVAEFV